MFYTKRTVEEQANRLPLSHRDNYTKTQLDRIEIDGLVVQGYFEYSFLEEKSYMQQPTRSSDGSIRDLDDYTVFLVPRLIIKYNMMGIEDYRTLMKLLKSKNTFNVTCYDIVEDKRVTHEMYFAPPSMPIIYQQYLMALGIKEYSIELIGTNNKQNVKVKQIYNFPSDVQLDSSYSSKEPYFEEDINTYATYKIGNFYVQNQTDDIYHIDYYVKNYTLFGWNTKADGSGVHYSDKKNYYFSADTELYAQWSRK